MARPRIYADRDADIWRLHDVEFLTHAQIGARLGISLYASVEALRDYRKRNGIPVPPRGARKKTETAPPEASSEAAVPAPVVPVEPELPRCKCGLLLPCDDETLSVRYYTDARSPVAVYRDGNRMMAPKAACE